jgi:regulatory protein YycH of two-component signal transduction system YycFG
MSKRVSRNMPSNGSDVTDRTSTFILGRRAFNFSSHNSENLKKNLDYSSVTNTITSNVYAKPLENMSSDLRIQRLRLATIGNASMVLKNDKDFIQLNGKNQDVNYVNNVLSRVRGGGYVAPKKGK